MNKPEYCLVCQERETLDTAGITVDPGEYVLERGNAGAFLAQSRKLALKPFDKSYRPALADPIKAGETVLIVRGGGYGDLLMATPIFRHLADRGCRVVVACFPRYAEVLAHNPNVWRVAPYPIPTNVWEAADKHVWLERILEDGVSGPGETFVGNGTDLMAKAAGVEPEQKQMRYDVTAEERAWARKTYPRKAGQKRVGLQLRASAALRSYPWGQLQVVGHLLARDGCEVMLFGAPGSCDTEGPFVNLTQDRLSFRQSCAVAEQCDALVTPDSSLCHIGGAMNIPTLALYGPFLSQTRTTHNPSVVALNGQAACAPCNFHVNVVEWPPGCPGHKTGCCAALESIPPGLVVAQVEHMLGGVKSAPMPPKVRGMKF